MPLAFEVKRDDPRTNRLVELPDPRDVRLAPGEVVVRVDQFAVTANNATYAVLGDAMRYWQFFSTSDEWGRVPAWGFGTVVRAEDSEVAVGDRYYGFFPMANYVVMHPEAVSATTFADGAPHRKTLHRLYNQYTRAPITDDVTDALQMLYRPLFVTSFILDDFFADHGYFGAQRMIVSSASSKTAYGMAYLVAARSRGLIELVGITGHVEFVRGLGMYDRVAVYDDLSLSPGVPSVYVDFSGNRRLRERLHAELGTSLAYSSAVGLTQALGNDPAAAEEALPPGRAAETFFAPAQIKKRIDEWGSAGFARRFDAAWSLFTSAVKDGGAAWLRISRNDAREAAGEAFERAASGRMEPEEGTIVTVP